MTPNEEKLTIKKNTISVNVSTRQGQNGSNILYLKIRRIYTRGTTTNKNNESENFIINQEANINMTAEDKVEDDSEDEEICHKKLGLPYTMEINVAHRYTHKGEKWFCLTYGAMEVQLIGTLRFVMDVHIQKLKRR